MDITCKIFAKNDLTPNNCEIKSVYFNESNFIRVNGIVDRVVPQDHKQVSNMQFYYGCRLEKFPRGLGSAFPYLRELNASDICIDKITREDFADFFHLKILNLNSNYIVSLPGDMFTNCQGLTSLHFRNNFIKFIDPKLFEPLFNLDFLDLNGNTCISNTWVNLSEDDELRQGMIDEVTRKCSEVVEEAPEKQTIEDENEEEKEKDDDDSPISVLAARIKQLERKFHNIGDWANQNTILQFKQKGDDRLKSSDL